MGSFHPGAQISPLVLFPHLRLLSTKSWRLKRITVISRLLRTSNMYGENQLSSGVVSSLLLRYKLNRSRMQKRPNHSVERDRPQAALVGSLRGFAATAAPHVKR